MVQLRIAFALLFIAATLGVSSALKCYVCNSIMPGEESCKDNPADNLNRELVAADFGGTLPKFLYCTVITATVQTVAVADRRYVGTPEDNVPLGCIDQDYQGAKARYCVCNTDGCNKSNNEDDYNGAPTMMLGLFPALVSLIAYSFFH